MEIFFPSTKNERKRKKNLLEIFFLCPIEAHVYERMKWKCDFNLIEFMQCDDLLKFLGHVGLTKWKLGNGDYHNGDVQIKLGRNRGVGFYSTFVNIVGKFQKITSKKLLKQSIQC